jgi:hypothetical protein
MKSWIKRFAHRLAVLILLFLLLCTCGCASYLQLAPAQPIQPYRGLNENTTIPSW